MGILYKFACCCRKWADWHRTSQCQRCSHHAYTVGPLTEDDDPAEWDAEHLMEDEQ